MKGRVSNILKVWEWQQLLLLDTVYIQRSTSPGRQELASPGKTHSFYTLVLHLDSLLQIRTDIFYWQCELAEGKSHTVRHYAPGNKSSLLREIIGSSTAKTATGLPIQTGFGENKIKVNSDWSAKFHQRTINRQETLLLLRDFSVKHEVIALYGKQILEELHYTFMA